MPSYSSYKRFLSILDEDDNIESWITVRGNHIPIMKGQSKAEAVRAFISNRRKKNLKNDGIIRAGSPDYGKPGQYEVFRSGNMNAPNGMIYTAPTFGGANTYANTGKVERKTVERWNVNIKNPLVIEGRSDVENLKLTYKALFGKDFGDKPLDEKTWQKYDAMFARKLNKFSNKYDAIITKINGEPREIQLPKEKALMRQTGSYNRYDMEWSDKEYIEAGNEDSRRFDEYWDFVNNVYKKGNPEHEKKEMELRLAMNNTYSSALIMLMTDDYYLKADNDSKK